MEEIKKTKKAIKVDEKAAKKIAENQKMLSEGLCKYCSKTKSCQLLKNYGETNPGDRCMDFIKK